MSTQPRYVARAVTGKGWVVWNRKTSRRWGNIFASYPDEVLAELNGQARPEVLTELCRGKVKAKTGVKKG